MRRSYERGKAGPQEPRHLVGPDFFGRVLLDQQPLDVRAFPVCRRLLYGEAVQGPAYAQTGQDDRDAGDQAEHKKQRVDDQQDGSHRHYPGQGGPDGQQAVGHLQRPDRGVDDGPLEPVVEAGVLETGQVRPAGGVDHLLHRRAGHQFSQEALHLVAQDERDRRHGQDDSQEHDIRDGR